jgi:hypothetical protein
MARGGKATAIEALIVDGERYPAAFDVWPNCMEDSSLS